MIKNLLKICLFTLLFCLSGITVAAPSWQIVPDKSELTFVATQNGAPVTGRFKTFSGEINFDPNDLAGSHIKIVVDMASITDPYNQLADNLKIPEWLNVPAFPQAVFISKDVVKTGDKAYEARGTLTLRDKTLPIVLAFNQEEYTNTNARMKGTATIERSKFGVGQGQWTDTKTVKDDVQINFVITATKK
jgi:polyisoprenoid-binding protein YceI